MKNIFVEGIQGMGKSTLVNKLAGEFPQLHICREGDYSPVDLAWCTWMTKEDYEAVLKRYASIYDEIKKNTVKEDGKYIITYTKIITDIPGFHKDLEQYEIYNGRKSLQEFKEIVFSRYRRWEETGYLFECAFFQNIIEDLILFHLLNDEEIIEFYRELYECMNKEQFLLLYLYSDKLPENIKIIQKERCDEDGNDMWYQMMLRYLVNSPYGLKHGYGTFDDMIKHFMHRQSLELHIIREVIGDNAKILPAKEWNLADVRMERD